MEDNYESSDQAVQEIGNGLSNDSKNMGMLCHLLGLFTGFIGPLILWMIKKEDDSFVDDQGKEALNWQITVTIMGIVGGILSIVMIGLCILGAVLILNLIFCIMGCLEASNGKKYRYPFALRLVK